MTEAIGSTGVVACVTNQVTGAAYQGKNVDRLFSATISNGYDPERGWAGFHQWITAGRVVRKGEHGTPCMTVVTVDKVTRPDGTTSGTRKPRGFRVFHYDQTTELVDNA